MTIRQEYLGRKRDFFKEVGRHRYTRWSIISNASCSTQKPGKKNSKKREKERELKAQNSHLLILSILHGSLPENWSDNSKLMNEDDTPKKSHNHNILNQNWEGLHFEISNGKPKSSNSTHQAILPTGKKLKILFLLWDVFVCVKLRAWEPKKMG